MIDDLRFGVEGICWRCWFSSCFDGFPIGAMDWGASYDDTDVFVLTTSRSRKKMK